MRQSLSTKPPSGFRDFLPRDAGRRQWLKEKINRVYQSFGFSPIETPALENLSVLQGSGGGENEKLIFKVLKRGEKLTEALANLSGGDPSDRIADFGLRFDLTVPLSRVVSEYRNDLKLPAKIFHIGSVWRAERAQKGRFREFTQCDVDIVGASSVTAEVDVIEAVLRVIETLGLKGFRLHLNDRRLLQNLATICGMGDRFTEFAILLDKKDKLDGPDLRSEFEKLLGGTIPELLQKILKDEFSFEAFQHDSRFAPELKDSLNRVIALLKSLKLPVEEIAFDPSLARGLGYYTGTIFELRHASAGYSLGGGGRYDGLLGRFGKVSIPACGFSIGFDRLLLLMEEGGVFDRSTPQRILFTVMDESLRPVVLTLAAELRGQGMSVSTYPEVAKLKNQLKFASEENYRWVLILGSKEAEKKEVALKDLKTGTEEKISFEKLSATLKVHTERADS